jgi:hypothetical protein|tara:strand:+ start:524 stop:766 length:243 start_codon:yes stop_codon:yes gene_type:complete
MEHSAQALSYGYGGMMTERKSVDTVVSVLKNKKKRLSVTSVKQVIAKALGLQPKPQPKSIEPSRAVLDAPLAEVYEEEGL